MNMNNQQKAFNEVASEITATELLRLARMNFGFQDKFRTQSLKDSDLIELILVNNDLMSRMPISNRVEDMIKDSSTKLNKVLPQVRLREEELERRMKTQQDTIDKMDNTLTDEMMSEMSSIVEGLDELIETEDEEMLDETSEYETETE